MTKKTKENKKPYFKRMMGYKIYLKEKRTFKDHYKEYNIFHKTSYSGYNSSNCIFIHVINKTWEWEKYVKPYIDIAFKDMMENYEI